MVNTTPLEEYESITFADWLRVKRIKFTHIPNETWTPSNRQKGLLKRLGVSSGVPDFMVVVENSIVFVEMKRQKGGVTSDTQKEWIKTLNKVDNVAAKVCRGATEAIQYIEEVISILK